jgi:hypothetical protein
VTPSPARIVDVTPGVIATALPALDGPTFLRLATPVGDPIDHAREIFLLRSDPHLRQCVGAWIGGPGLIVQQPAAVDVRALAREVHEVGNILRLLSDPTIAARYLALAEHRVPASGGDVVPTQDKEEQ